MRYDFIEIGTSDFDTLTQSIQNKIGISIEPLKFYLDNLPDNDNVIKLNCAISDKNGIVDVYWIDPIDIENYNLPGWLRGCNSIVEPHPSAIKELKDRNIEHIYKKTQCKCLTWESIVDIYDIKYVDYLKIDTEGHDYIIINNILNSNSILPNKILFENNILTTELNTRQTLERLKSFGYTIVQYGDFDILVEKL
jgi:FkbM family methyltransferase